MNNTNHCKQVKGSKKWIQTVTSEKKYKETVDNLLGVNLKWVSPVKETAYKEFELISYADDLGLNKEEAKAIFSFWPKRQPQWDGMAIGRKGEEKDLYLFEAKAHINELRSYCQAKPGENRKKIEEALRSFQKENYPDANTECWLKGYYQLANRLLFLNKIKAMKSTEYAGVKLVLLYFANDFTHIPTTVEKLSESSEKAMLKLTGVRAVPQDVIELFIDVETPSKSKSHVSQFV